METLLPSEVARLVLGYLEEENCQGAAKCFLDLSQNLSEYRLLAQKGKKYPTKVNGYSLKEILEEYCLVHSIVQDSLSSMTEQPSVSGNMIECLRFLVRACQPVQVHINLHPQQGQGSSSTSKSEVPDISSVVSQPHLKKISPLNPNYGDTQETSATPSGNAPEYFGSDIVILGTDNNETPSVLASSNVMNCSSLIVDDSNRLQNRNLLSTPLETKMSSEQWSEKNLGSLPTRKSADSDVPSFRTQLNMKETTPLSQNFDNVLENSAAQTVNSHKYFGSNIVILDRHNTEPTLASSSGMNSNNFVDDNGRRLQNRNLLSNPVKATMVIEQLSEKMLKNETMVSKLVENINRVWTPSEQLRNEDSQALGEAPQDLDEAVYSILKETEEDPCFDQFLHEFLQFDNSRRIASKELGEFSIENSKNFRKKKHIITKKPKSFGNQQKRVIESTITNEGLAKVESKDTCFTASEAEGATPAKAPSGTDSMTPMTKLLKSITSPSGDMYADPSPFAGFLDLPCSDVKEKDQDIPATPSIPFQPLSGNEVQLNNLIQVSQPNGTTVSVPIVFCESNQQVAQYVNEEGARTLCEIQVMPQHGSYVPIAPKVQPVVSLPTTCFGLPETLQPSSSTSQLSKVPIPSAKRVLTRGGRHSAGQLHPVPSESPESKNTLTLYAGDQDNAASSTIDYCPANELPIIVQDDTVNVAISIETLNPSGSAKTRKFSSLTSSIGEDESDKAVEVVAESKPELFTKEEGMNMPLLNVSIERNTPGLAGIGRSSSKRLSLSTPRRRFSHIRALDFNTPPKDSDQSLRRANTSPKNISSTAFSPHTTGKSIKSSTRGGLVKLSGDATRKTGSKVKTHLFQSPEYIMNSSSDFKVPSSAVTSTPANASPLPQPSEAWDKIGGVSLILDPEAHSPSINGTKPPCQKVKKSWDADLRSILSIPEPKPVPSRKRKSLSSHVRKETKTRKSVGSKKETKLISTVDQSKSHNLSNESTGEMAKLLEQNLMEDIAGVVTSPKQCSPFESNKLFSSPNLNAVLVTKDNVAPDSENSKAEGTVEKNQLQEEKPSNDRLSATQDIEEIPAKPLNVSGDTSMAMDTCDAEDGLTLIANTALRFSEKNKLDVIDAVSDTTNGLRNSLAGSCVKNSVVDPCVPSSQKASLKECLVFETPVKDDLSNIVPRTPYFVNLSSPCKEDTPRTKIIKALPFGMDQPTGSSDSTPTLSVPPTPSIQTTPTVSPKCPSYFQPSQQPSPDSYVPCTNDSPSSKSVDNLENILVQECSRIEADDMHGCRTKYNNKYFKNHKEFEILAINCDDNSVKVKEGSGKGQDKADATVKTMSAMNVTDDSDTRSSEKDGNKSPFAVQEQIHEGCARFQRYNRKERRKEECSKSEMTVSKWVKEVSKKGPFSSDEADDCIIVSPVKKFHDASNVESLKTNKQLPDVSEQSSSNCEIIGESSILLSRLDVQGLDKKDEDSLELTSKSGKGSNVPSSPTVMAFPEPEQSSAVKYSCKDSGHITLDSATSSPQKLSESVLMQHDLDAEKIKGSPKKSFTEARNVKQDVTDNESCGSSSDDSSSDSDSESTSSSSSSEEEDTLIEDNMPPLVLTHPIKTGVSCNSKQIVSKTEASRIDEPTLIQSNQTKDTHSKDSSTLPNMELKSLLELEDVNILDKSLNSRSSLSLMSFNSELELKRQRTMEQLRSSAVTKEKVISRHSSSIKSFKSSNVPIEPESKKILFKHNAVGSDLATEIPKKQSTIPETSDCSTKELQQVSEKQNSEVDKVKITDEDDIQLYLSDHEELSQQTSSDSVESQLAAMFDGSAQLKALPKTMVTVISETEQCQIKTNPAICPKTNNSSSKLSIYRKANDALIKNLVEEGLGCSLPCTSFKKIKKISSDASCTPVQVKSDVKAACGEDNNTASIAKLLPEEKSSTLEAEDNYKEGDEEAHTDEINTSLSSNSRDIKIFYKGLGRVRPKEDPDVIKRQCYSLEGEMDVHLAPSPLIHLCFKNPVENVAYVRRNQRCEDSRSKNSVSNSDSFRRYSDDRTDGDSQYRFSRDRKSGSRASRRHEDYRLRRNRSPSPRFQRTCGYDYYHSRESHRKQEYHSHFRRDLNLKQHKSTPSEARGSDLEPRSVLYEGRKSKDDAEDGELLSSDNEVETRQRKTKEAGVSQRNSRLKECRVAAERNLKNSKSYKNSISPSRGSNPKRKLSQLDSTGHSVSLNACREAGGLKCRKDVLSNHEKASKAVCTDNDLNDADLDSVNFPVLGEDDANDNETKDSEHNSSVETNESSKLALRRAPPRSVNAHKLSSEIKTPVQKGKRKLSSSSPDAEDSYQSSATVYSKAKRSHRHPRKSPDSPSAFKVLKLNEEKAAESYMPKNFNVEDFLDQIHGGSS